MVERGGNCRRGRVAAGHRFLELNPPRAGRTRRTSAARVARRTGLLVNLSPGSLASSELDSLLSLRVSGSPPSSRLALPSRSLRLEFVKMISYRPRPLIAEVSRFAAYTLFCREAASPVATPL
ncbi:hypothetical protein Dimus_024943 [Dionaea muscipula]